MRRRHLRGSQAGVDKLVRQIEAIDRREAEIKKQERKASLKRLSAAYVPVDATGEIVVKRVGFGPLSGWHRMICRDVADLGIQQTPWGPRDQVEFAFELEARREDGRRHMVWKKFSPSLNDNSTLRKFLEVWQGYPFAEQELKAGIPLAHRYIGRSGLVLLEPITLPPRTEGEVPHTYLRVVAAYPLPAKAAPVKPEGFYVRKAYRARREGAHDESAAGVGGVDGGAAGTDGRGDLPGDGAGAGHGAAEAVGVVPAGAGGREPDEAADAAGAVGDGVGADAAGVAPGDARRRPVTLRVQR